MGVEEAAVEEEEEEAEGITGMRVDVEEVVGTGAWEVAGGTTLETGGMTALETGGMTTLEALGTTRALEVVAAVGSTPSKGQ